MSLDLDDLLGADSVPKPARRLSEETERRLAAQRALLSGKTPATLDPDDDTPVQAILDEGGMPDAVVFTRPVNITFMAKVLGVETRRLHNRLSKCPIVGFETKGRNAGRSPLYDFKVAIKYCVDPKVGIGEWIKSQSSTSLPPMINKAFWEAERVKMRVKEEAGELWHTSDIQRLLGDTAMTIKDAMTLWVEHLPGVEQMSTEQYQHLRKQVAALQTEIYRLMVEAPKEGRKTESYRADIEELELLDVGADDDGDSEAD